MADTRAPLRKAKTVGDQPPAEIFTDGMKAYPRAIRKEFGWSSETRHHRVPSIRAAESNNMVERLHGTEKERIKVMRGFDTRRGTAALMEGFRVHYNMVRDHQALGTTPGSLAGLPQFGGFRWFEILEMATKASCQDAEIRIVAEPTPDGGQGASVGQTTPD